MASQLLERKMNNILASGANIVITGNPGCMMQIALGAQQKGYELAVMHPVQLLDEFYQAKGIYEVADRERRFNKKTRTYARDWNRDRNTHRLLYITPTPKRALKKSHLDSRWLFL